MAAQITTWLVRWSALRALGYVLTGHLTSLEARTELLRRIRGMSIPELNDLARRLEAMAPPSTSKDSTGPWLGRLTTDGPNRAGNVAKGGRPRRVMRPRRLADSARPDPSQEIKPYSDLGR